MTAYKDMTPEERRAMVARRDPEKVRAADRRRYDRNRERRLAAMRAYRETPEGRAKLQAAAAAWRVRNPEKRRAQNAVSNAIRDGRLQRPETCSVDGCEKKPQAHHDDYSKPLEVIWLCTSHHHDRHREERGLPR